MKLIKRFIKQNKGVSIVEYVLLLCLLGTIIVAVSPTVRDSVGDMYAAQTNSTNNLNGMEGSRTTSRFGTEATPSRTPNTSEENANTIEYTTDPTVNPTAPQEKEVTVTLKRFDTNFPDEVIYDQEGYYGVLPKDAASPTSEVVDTRRQTDTKNVVETLQTATLEEMEQIESYEKEDAEGYKGVMNPVSDIRYVPTSTSGMQYDKDSGDVYVVRELSEPDPVLAESQMPDPYYYEEVDSATGEYTGYAGEIPKVDGMQETSYMKDGVMVYRYEQKYRGIISKYEHSYDYVYERDFGGTLFKTTEEDVVEYSQTYTGIVTERQ